MGTKTQKLSNTVDSIVQWQSVFVGDGSTGLTAVAGRGYFIDTTSGSVTVTLPASPKPGDVVQLKDYARNWATNAVSLASAKLDGVTTTNAFSTNGQIVTLVYVDDTNGWTIVNDDAGDIGGVFIKASGGTETTDGDFKIHTFTGDGTFTVAAVGNAPATPRGGPAVADYLVVAGGGGTGGGEGTGGGGAGGFRESKDTGVGSPHIVSPLAASSGITLTAQTYPITVGAGGAAVASGTPNPTSPAGGSGSNSVFSTITSAGGGGGGSGGGSPSPAGVNGGSGGGAGGRAGSPGGSGNTPPVSPPQGNNGGNGAPSPSPDTVDSGGGGGAAGAVGCNAADNNAGNGGNGVNTRITGGPALYAGGGGGGSQTGSEGQAGNGGGGRGGGGGGNGNDATANTGGGGGGRSTVPSEGGSGGKGIVVIRYKYQ